MNRRGAALIVALLALMIAGALASAALATGRVRWRAGLTQGAAARASVEVQSALDRYASAWSSHRFDSLPVATVREIVRHQGTLLRRHDSITRLSPSLFQVRSVAELGPPGEAPLGRDAAALLLRLAPLELQDSAVVLAPAVILKDAARIDGSDRVPSGWAARCPAPGPAILTHLIDSTPFAHFRDDPRPLLHPTSGTDSVAVLQGGNHLVDGINSGILWAQGSLELSGDFYFAGVMLVEGSLLLRDRARVDGVVLAAGAVELSGLAEINHSRCAARLPLQANPVVPQPVAGGWWRLDQ